MSHTIHAIFDGEVLRPEESVPLKPNTRYRVTLEEDDNGPSAQAGHLHPLQALLAIAEDMDVPDLAERHDYYRGHRH